MLGFFCGPYSYQYYQLVHLRYCYWRSFVVHALFSGRKVECNFILCLVIYTVCQLLHDIFIEECQRSSHLECRSLCPLHTSQCMHGQCQPPCGCVLSRNILFRTPGPWGCVGHGRQTGLNRLILVLTRTVVTLEHNMKAVGQMILYKIL